MKNGIKRKLNNFTLLEILVAISILILAAGALFYRISTLIDKKHFDSDSARLEQLLLSTRTLALNSQSDWRLAFKKSSVNLFCRENPDLSYTIPPFTAGLFHWNDEPAPEFIIDFFSSGLVRPTGQLVFAAEEKKSSLNLPALFKQVEDGPIGPLKPGK
jgi:type II secretory pathway pseudopilin PulG